MINEDPNKDASRENIRPDLEPCFEGPLTKQALMKLPEGILLQSNVPLNPLTPVYEGVLGTVESREILWHSLKRLGVDGRPFRGYTASEAYDRDFMKRPALLERWISSAKKAPKVPGHLRTQFQARQF